MGVHRRPLKATERLQQPTQEVLGRGYNAASRLCSIFLRLRSQCSRRRRQRQGLALSLAVDLVEILQVRAGRGPQRASLAVLRKTQLLLVTRQGEVDVVHATRILGKLRQQSEEVPHVRRIGAVYRVKGLDGLALPSGKLVARRAGRAFG